MSSIPILYIQIILAFLHTDTSKFLLTQWQEFVNITLTKEGQSMQSKNGCHMSSQLISRTFPDGNLFQKMCGNKTYKTYMREHVTHLSGLICARTTWHLYVGAEIVRLFGEEWNSWASRDSESRRVTGNPSRIYRLPDGGSVAKHCL